MIMKQQSLFSSSNGTYSLNLGGKEVASRHAIVAGILAIALIAFEIFNFDTTQFALESLLGSEKFLGVMWASILAIAFCSIDFAGLIRIFTPERGADEPRVVWYLMGAWLLGATMNAVMTWWAVSLTLLNHDFGNEVLSREQLLRYVPIFVAALVLLTRILFIGAFTVAGEQVMQNVTSQKPVRRRVDSGKAASLPEGAPRTARHTPAQATSTPAAPRPSRRAPSPLAASPATSAAPASSEVTYHSLEEDVLPAPVRPQGAFTTGNGHAHTPGNGTSRIRNRPPLPNGRGSKVHGQVPGRH
jgi:hypothetical protein